MQLPILTGRITHMLLKKRKEIIPGGETQFIADILYGHIRIGQQLADQLQLFLNDVVGQGITGAFFKDIPQVVYRQMNLLSQDFYGKVGVVKIFFHQIHNLVHHGVLFRFIAADLG